jgi:hypothetical protein
MAPVSVSARLAAALTLAISFTLLAPTRATAELEDPDENALGEDDADEESDVDPQEDSKHDEADRNHVAGKAEGSLAFPIALKDEARLEKLCAALQGSRGAKPEDDFTVLAANKRIAMRDVYTVLVQPGGFKVGDYKNRSGRLPLRLEHPLFALDSALRLVVAQKSGGSFVIPAKEASAILNAIEEKKLALEVSFRIDGDMADTLAPCFSYPKSAAYVLNVEPLTYALIEVGNNHRRRAEQKTPALAELKEWMAPGKARLAIIASSEGPVDSDALTKAVEAKRGELEACFGSLMQSSSAVGMVAYEASLTPQGAIADVRVEAEALEDDAAQACAQKVIAAIGVAKTARASKAHVALTIERGDEDAPMITD